MRGYGKLVNTTMAVKKLEANEYRKEGGLNRIEGEGFDARATFVVLVSESGLYKLVMRSDKPEARRFQNWVTGTVLPAIRKDGAYVMGEEKVATGEMDEDEFVLKAIGILQRKIDRLSAENKVMATELNVVTIDEYRALTHRDFTPGFKSQLGKKASSMARDKGITIEKQERKLAVRGKEIDVQVNVYPRALLEEAEALLIHATMKMMEPSTIWTARSTQLPTSPENTSRLTISTTGARTSGLKSFPYRLKVIPPAWCPRSPPTRDSVTPFCLR